MRLSWTWTSRPTMLFLTFLLAFLPFTSATRLIESSSLNTCMDNSSFTASLFNVVFTPDNNTISFDIVGVSSISGNVTAELQVIAYGYNILSETLDPCSMDLSGMCPMNTGQINIESNLEVSDSVISNIPGIAYTVPDLDGVVKIYINNTDTGECVACMEADLSNGKTVNQKAVGWATAVIAGLALVVSAITSGLGNSNTAAHVAANALSLFSFFQAQAMIGMTAVSLPPIVASWTQNFQWAMGIIHIGFIQNIATWYQTATGGTASTTLSTLSTTSVEVDKKFRSVKRSAVAVRNLVQRAFDLQKRTNSDSSVAETTTTVIVRGIKRVGFRADIESTNIFMTGMIFTVAFVVLVIFGVVVFKFGSEALVKMGAMKTDKFQDFRNGWKVVLKGILFRIVLIAYPQMCILDLWELTQRDSAAEVVVAIFFFIFTTVLLTWAALKVIYIAKRSVILHKNPAYILYSDPAALNKWGFLYVQYRATAYYFVVPTLIHIMLKAIFVAFGQTVGTVQAVALVIIEALGLIGVSVLRPYMDKKTNIFNIAIFAINFVNVLFLLVFTSIFGQPGLVTGVMGVVFFVLNAVFATVLLVTVLVASVYAIFSKNPDNRYQPMRDDRGSFIKSNGQLTTELDALGATARGDYKAPYKTRDLDEDEGSYSSESMNRSQGQETAASGGLRQPPSNQAPVSPIDPSVPLFPSETSSRSGNPSYNPNPYGGDTEGLPNNIDPRTGDIGLKIMQVHGNGERAMSDEGDTASNYSAEASETEATVEDILATYYTPRHR
ncbi:MAG: hypothetical protein M1834_001298 [Cirrosporium novae-zelandiae]|nr:MAG: hypothetical protein M1834_001298 [Cirrosporium novae-zelandiae]